jgi:thiosulfate dehydrogenase
MGLTDADIESLVKFVVQGQIDTASIIGTNGLFKGNIARGQTLYRSGIGANIGCALCHGTDGLAQPPGNPAFSEFPGFQSKGNPWEFQHKVQFGHPGTVMPSAVDGGGTLQDLADLAAFCQTLPATPPPPSVARGGALYDQWWSVKGMPAPTNNHPLWALRPDTTSNTRTGEVTFRCKECHGWDYKGVNGAYGKGSHRTGFGGIFGTTKTGPELTDLLKNHHSYTAAGLNDADIESLVQFVLQGQIDTAAIIETNGVFKGSVTNGQVLYATGIGSNLSCSGCHGTDGLGKPPGYPDYVEYPGLLSKSNPWEFQHKVRFGNPGTAMPGTVGGGGTLQEVSDVSAYSQTLPSAPLPSPRPVADRR